MHLHSQRGRQCRALTTPERGGALKPSTEAGGGSGAGGSKKIGLGGSGSGEDDQQDGPIDDDALLNLSEVSMPVSDVGG